MLDIKYIRENPEIVKEGIKNKNEKDTVDQILNLDKQRRDLLQKAEELKAQRNKVSQEIGKVKKSGGNADEVMAEMKNVSDEIKELDNQIREVEEKLNEMMLWVPNLPHSSTPVGKSAANNIEVNLASCNDSLSTSNTIKVGYLN